MKKLFFFLLFIPLLTISQEYSEVIQVEGKSTDQLYSSAREWFALTFNSANDVLQMDDPVAGKLIGKGSIHLSESYVAGKGLTAVPITLEWYPSFTIKVEVREGRYKCDVTDIIVKDIGTPIGTIEQPYQVYIDSLNYYKNGRNPEWLLNNPPGGIKVGKTTARYVAQANEAAYKMILNIEKKVIALMDELEKAMKSNVNDDW